MNRQKAEAAARSGWGATIWFVALLLVAPHAVACPSCVEGVQARAAVWQDDFGPQLVVVLLPFLVIGVLCARAEAIGRLPESTGGTDRCSQPQTRGSRA